MKRWIVTRVVEESIEVDAETEEEAVEVANEIDLKSWDGEVTALYAEELK